MSICRTAKELIEALSALDPETKIYTTEPPFTGIMLVPQGSGSLMIASLRDTPEWRLDQTGSAHAANFGAIQTRN